MERKSILHSTVSFNLSLVLQQSTRRTHLAILIVSAGNHEYGALADYSIDGPSLASRGRTGGRGGLRAVSATTAPDRSYGNESQIFGHAGLESSIDSSTEILGYADTPATKIVRPAETRKQERERLEREEILLGHARKPVAPRAWMQDNTTAMAESFSQKMYRFGDKALDDVASIIQLFWR